MSPSAPRGARLSWAGPDGARLPDHGYGRGVASDSTDGPPAVVCGALVRDGRVLMVHRSPARRWYPDVWDLPGGHVEAGEEPRGALVRELREELGVDAKVVGGPIARTAADDFVMDVWAVRSWSGEPFNAAPHEHDDLAWLGPGDLAARALAHPDLPAQVRRALEG